MAVLFRPTYPVDYAYWIDTLKAAFGDDLRIYPETGPVEEIDYYITWTLFEGDEEAYPNLKAVLALSAGVNFFTKSPHMPDAPLYRMIEDDLTQGMAEYVLSFVMRFHREHDAIASKLPGMTWFETVPKMAHERRVSILGLGTLGQACAKPLIDLGFQVSGWSRTRKDMPAIQSFAGQDELPAFLGQSDILVCLLPLTPETKNILNKETLMHLPKGAYLINAARGPLLVEEDLIEVLDSGHLSMAALDVFRKEPLPQDHPFYSHPSVIVTPHLAAITNPENGARILKENIDLLRAGKEPPGRVDFKTGY